MCTNTEQISVFSVLTQRKKLLFFPIFIRILSICPVKLYNLCAIFSSGRSVWQCGDKNSILNLDIFDGALFFIFFKGYDQFRIKKKVTTPLFIISYDGSVFKEKMK